MIPEIIKACFTGPLPYRIFSVILSLLVIIWIGVGIRIISPKLEIFYNKALVAGKTITIDKTDKYNRYMFPLDNIYIKNTGVVPIKNISIRIHCSEEVKACREIWETPTGSTVTCNWSITNSPLDEYTSLLEFKEQISLNQMETWNRRYRMELDFNNRKTESAPIYCKCYIYYGLDKPLEVEFILKSKPETISNKKMT